MAKPWSWSLVQREPGPEDLDSEPVGRNSTTFQYFLLKIAQAQSPATGECWGCESGERFQFVHLSSSLLFQTWWKLPILIAICPSISEKRMQLIPNVA